MYLEKIGHRNAYTIGLDISMTGSGVYFCGMSPELDDFYYALTSEGRDLYREIDVFRSIHEDIHAILNFGYKIDLACIEDYGPINKFAGKLTQRAEICGMLKYSLLCEFGIPVVMSGPKSVKKFATGNGNSKKEAMIIAAANLYGIFTDDDNVADASHLGHLGYAIVCDRKVGVNFERYNP